MFFQLLDLEASAGVVLINRLLAGPRAVAGERRRTLEAGRNMANESDIKGRKEGGGVAVTSAMRGGGKELNKKRRKPGLRGGEEKKGDPERFAMSVPGAASCRLGMAGHAGERANQRTRFRLRDLLST